MHELRVLSVDACANPLYLRLGLTDAAIASAVGQAGCSVLTNDSELYAALYGNGSSVVLFDHLREFL
jgi:hypothetical protein